VVVLFLRKVFPCLLIEERGSLVIEGVVVFPVIMVLLFSFISFFNYFSVSSYIRQRVDSYGAYVSSVGGVVGDGIGEFGVPDDLLEIGVSMGSKAYLRSYLLKEGVLEGDRLVVVSDFDGGYMTVRVEYGVDVVLLGRVVVVDFYERRLW
jgi:hypothetical protein